MPPAWTVLVATVGVIWLLAPRGIASRWIGLVLFLPALLATPPRPLPGEAWITTLDVGQGLSVLVRTSEHALLFDTGPAYADSDSGERIIAPYLRAIGATQLDAMIVSHNDIDHSGGALSVMRDAQVGRLVSSLELSSPIVLAASEPSRCLRGEKWRWDGVEFEVIHPAPEDYAGGELRINDLSCVLRVATSHGTMLLTGDIEKTAEALIVQREGEKLRAHAMIAPHHGSRTSSSAALIAAVRPEIVVIPVGYRNRFGHPRADVVARYLETNAKVLRTDLDGAVMVHFGAAGVQARGERAARPRYWRNARL